MIPEQIEDKELIELSDEFAKQIEKIRNSTNVPEIPSDLIKSNNWTMGFQMGYQQAIQDLKIKIK